MLLVTRSRHGGHPVQLSGGSHLLITEAVLVNELLPSLEHICDLLFADPLVLLPSHLDDMLGRKIYALSLLEGTLSYWDDLLRVKPC